MLHTLRIFAALAILLMPYAARAEYPERTITLVTPFGTGAAFAAAHLFADQLEKVLRVPVVVKVMTSGSGAIGTYEVVRAAPDGYTALVGGTSNLVLPFTAAPRYDARTDLVPAGFTVALAPSVLIVRPDHTGGLPALRDKLWSASGRNVSHFAGAQLLKRAGIDARVIPAKNESDAARDFLSKVVDFAILLGNTAMPLIQSGKAIPLVQLGTVRSAAFPDVPSVTELGIKGFVDMPAYNSIWFPKATPPEIVEKMTQAIRAVQDTRDDEFAAKLRVQGIQIHRGGPGAVRSWLESTYVEWHTLVDELGFTRD